MRRLLVVLVLGAYVCSVTELHQFFKVPALFAHYAEDLEERPDEGFLCFLADHYLQGAHHSSEEREDHEQLPFHGHHDCTMHAQQTLPIAPIGAILAPTPRPASEPCGLVDACYAFQLSRDVWQPPRA